MMSELMEHESEHACCAPSADRGHTEIDESAVEPGKGADSALTALVHVDGGDFMMGTDGRYGYPADGEGPAHKVSLSPFEISPTTVTNAEFKTFVDATGYRTEAERFGTAFVFGGLLPDDFAPTRGVVDAPWWREVERADWAHPEGPQSNLHDRLDHPVVQVSWNDAQAFCKWSGTRLPTEAEWEMAARGGLEQQRFPWGDEFEPNGEHRMNVFQGTFPGTNTKDDGYAGTAPATSFPANGFGMRNMTGNVWEWCADWFAHDYYSRSAATDPAGPATGAARVTRGGSYLCHASYCNRYRVDARGANSPDSSTGNTGFRVARSITAATS
jgi:formylglycine-generating enzyme required for sulfatase activity